MLAVILDCDAMKWFKPAKGQFQIFFYQYGADHSEYQPNFVAETNNAILMLKSKTSKMTAPLLLAKKEVASKWYKNAFDYWFSNLFHRELMDKLDKAIMLSIFN